MTVLVPRYGFLLTALRCGPWPTHGVRHEVPCVAIRVRSLAVTVSARSGRIG